MVWVLRAMGSVSLGGCLLAMAAGCSDSGADDGSVVADGGATGADADTQTVDGGATDGGGLEGPFKVITMNVGTTKGLGHDGDSAGYSDDLADISDEHYGNGLAWVPAINGARDFLADTSPVIVVFQEIFHPEECAGIPADKKAGFICETWQAGDPTVAQMVLGDGWQVMCHPGKSDKCAAVRRDFGSFKGCDDDLCIEGMDGYPVQGCGGGARVARGVIELEQGGELTLINYHGTSGVGDGDQDCRKDQTKQVFEDLGDGAPGANGTVNLIMGDLNTDPDRMALFDSSARKWSEFVGGSYPFQWISEIGDDAPPSYSGLFNIDHVISDSITGSCLIPGADAGTDPMMDTTYFDHMPVVCTVELP